MGAVPSSTSVGTPRQDLSPMAEFLQMLSVFKIFEFLPPRRTQNRVAIYPKFTAKGFAHKPPTGKHADGNPRPRMNISFGTTEVTTEGYGLESQCPVVQSQQYSGWFDNEAVTRDAVVQALMRSIESDGAAVMQATATFTNSAATAIWTNLAAAKPITDSVTAKNAIFAKTGRKPNRVGICDERIESIWMNAEVRAAMSAAGMYGKVIEGKPNLEVLAQILGIDKVVNLDAMYDTANPGAAASMGPIWDKTKIVYAYVDENQDPGAKVQISVGHTLWWANAFNIPIETMTVEQVAELMDLLGVFEYPEPQTGSNIVGVQGHLKHHVAVPECGYIITGA